MAKMIEGMEQLLRGDAPQPPAARLIGMALESFGPGDAVVVLQADARHGNPMGTVQGGLINFLKPVWNGRVAARGRVRNAGRTVGLVECDVVDGGEGLVAHAVGTCMVLRGQQATGR